MEYASQLDEKKTLKRTRIKWTEESERLLVEIWAEKLPSLKGNRGNNHVYAEMAEELKEIGLYLLGEDIKCKIHDMTSRYRLEKKKIESSGASSSSWPLYGAVHKILESSEVMNPDKIEEGSESESYDILENVFGDEMKTLKRKRIKWTEKSERLLAEIWAEKLPSLKDNRRNNHIYAEMAEELKKTGFSLEGVDIKCKIHNMTNRHHLEKKKIESSGGYPSNWPLYDAVHKILESPEVIYLEEVVEESSEFDSNDIFENDFDEKRRSKRKQRVKWTEESEKLLAEMWAEKLPCLRANRKTSRIYAKLAEKLKKMGFSFAGLDIKYKIHNMTNRYRIEKKKIESSGGSPSNWHLYDAVHKILGTPTVTNLNEVIENSSEFDSNDIFESYFDEKKRVKRKRRVEWTEESEKLLAEMWAEKLSSLKSNRKTSHIYAEMAEELRMMGFSFAGLDVKNKIHNMKNRYRLEQKKIESTEGSLSTWPLYGAVHKILESSTVINLNEVDGESSESESYDIGENDFDENRRLKRKQRVKWTEESENLLAELWEENLVSLRANRRTGPIYAKMAEALRKTGFSFTGLEIKDKIHNITNRYRMEKKKIESPEGSPSNWPLYDAVHKILGTPTVINLNEVVEDSSEFDSNDIFECDFDEKKRLKRKQRVKWTEESEKLLADMWADKLPSLRANRKTSHIYAQMAEELKKMGFSFAGLDIQYKIHNMTNRYRMEKKQIESSGGSPSNWPLYDAVHKILGSSEMINFDEGAEIKMEFESYTILEYDFDQTSSSGPQCSSVLLPEMKKKRRKVEVDVLTDSRDIDYKEDLKAARKAFAESEQRALQLQEQSIAIGAERNAILRQMIAQNNEFQKEFLELLANK